MKGSLFAGFAAVVTFVLAGCIGSSDATPAGGGGNVAPAPVIDETTGAIRGLVMTDEIQPIVGAHVGVVGTTIIATTDDSGRYVLNFVPPGPQTISALALGFEAQGRKLDVVAGQLADGIDFILASLPTAGPYHTITTFKLVIGGYMVKATPDCMYPLPGQSTYKTCVGGSFCNTGPCEMHYGHCKDHATYGKYGCDLTPEWQTIIAELDWTPQSGVTGRGWIFEVLAPNVTRANADSGSVDQSDKHDFFAISSKSPIRHWIDDDAMQARGLPAEDRCGGKTVEYPSCDWVWRVFPGWCTVGGLTNSLAGCENTGPDFAFDYAGNPVNVYFSYFVTDPAPAMWSALPDK